MTRVKSKKKKKNEIGKNNIRVASVYSWDTHGVILALSDGSEESAHNGHS